MRLSTIHLLTERRSLRQRLYGIATYILNAVWKQYWKSDRAMAEVEAEPFEKPIHIELRSVKDDGSMLVTGWHDPGGAIGLEIRRGRRGITQDVIYKKAKAMLAHELRHPYQHIKDPAMFDDYPDSDVSYNTYRTHKAEVEAWLDQIIATARLEKIDVGIAMAQLVQSKRLSPEEQEELVKMYFDLYIRNKQGGNYETQDDP